MSPGRWACAFFLRARALTSLQHGSPLCSPFPRPCTCRSRRAIAAVALGKKIVTVYPNESSDAPVFDQIVCADAGSATGLAKALQGRTILELDRRGKYMWWKLSGDGPTPVWHFGMTGGFSIKAPGAERGYEAMSYKSTKAHLESWPPKFCKVELVLEGGCRLAFTDPRRLGRLRLVSDPLTEGPVSELGPDALLALPAVPAFIAQVRARGAPIKALLLDQSFLAGIGNWIADEVCYQARVHPGSSSKALSDADLARLHGAIVSVISVACEAGADDSRVPPDYLFHFRWAKGSKTGAKDYHGRSISFVTVGGRTSAVVTAVQGAPRKAMAAAPKASKVAAAATVVVEEETAVVTAAAAVVGKKRCRGPEAAEEEEAAAASEPAAKRRRGSAKR